jgi:uncharacterized protein YgbK (DUF1537 family)
VNGGETSVLIVADDLTGALDTAGSIASPGRPFDVPLRSGLGRGLRIAIDTDSRDLGQLEAERRVADIFRVVERHHQQIVFKKIDSVMRGHPIAEMVSAFRSGGFDRALLAPAFPDLGRVTRGGQQFVVDQGRSFPVGPSMPDAVRAFGLSVVTLSDAHPAADVVIADAEDNASLVAAVARIRELGGRTLFVGSAGLAQALGPASPTFIEMPQLDLAICGTVHPATLDQVRKLDGSAIKIRRLDGDGFDRSDFPVAYIAPETVGSDSAARPLIARSIVALARAHGAPRTALLTGGWTLRTLLDYTKADRLQCSGLYIPGVPVSFVSGGQWDGTMIASKSGGFGGPDLLADLFRTT